MEFVQEKGFSDKEEEEEEEEMRETSKLSFLSSSSSSASSKSKTFQLPHHQNLWLGKSECHIQEEAAARSYDQAVPPAEAINFNSKLQLMELSLGNDYDIEAAQGVGATSTTHQGSIEREHMFDKVVTPSDVGKLNRLVIPKQHAEKFFPLDTSTHDKGLLLSFEDRNGKPWRFRYSYWNSSQSYVMTKGWSRFVKEKKLDPGDIVSFQRGVGELGKDHLYIDWKRRVDAINPTLSLTNHPQFNRSVRWPSRLYSSTSMPQHQDYFQQMNYNIHPYHHHHHHHQQYHHDYNAMNSVPGAPLYYLRSSALVPQGGDVNPMEIDDSVQQPVVHHHGKTVAKRLRLFGVNMECSIPEEEPECSMLSSATLLPHVTMPNAPTVVPTIPSEFSNKGKSSFDF